MSNKTKIRQAGKGDKRRPYDHETYSKNYEEIKWQNGTTCCNCGKFFSLEKLTNQKDSYISYSDGSVECKNCNFN